MLRVLVTRPAPDAGQWVEHLQQAGFDAAALPLIEIAPLLNAASLAALQQARQTLSTYAALMFVSGNAVSYFFREKDAVAQCSRQENATNNIADKNLTIVPPGLRLLAPGPGTAAALLATGVPSAQIDAPPEDAEQFDSEALWQLVGKRDWQGRRVLIVRGQSPVALSKSLSTPGRDWLMRQWQAAGATVDTVTVYERRAPQMAGADMALAKNAATDGAVWLFSSSEAIGNLMTQPGMAAIRWHEARAVATHPRIAQAARAAGWGVVVESRPALTDIIRTLRSIESNHP